MSDSQRQYFNENRLSFNTIAESSGSAMAINVGDGITPAVYGGSTAQRWIAYHGRGELKELQFYDLLADASLHQQAVQREAQISGDTISAYIIFLLATLWGAIATACSFWLIDNVGTANFTFGLIVSAIIPASMVVLPVTGILKLSNAARLRKSNVTPLNVVAPLADEFNRKLARQILGVA